MGKATWTWQDYKRRYGKTDTTHPEPPPPEPEPLLAIKDGDRHVGERVAELRRSRGLSQQSLAEILECSFQQVQKYEKGDNRVSPGRLARMASVFGVSPAWFFEGLPVPGSSAPTELEKRAKRIAMYLDGMTPSLAASFEELISSAASPAAIKAARGT